MNAKEPIHLKEPTNPKESTNPKDSIPSTPPATPAPGSFKTVRSFSIKQRLQSQTQGTATSQATTPTLQTQPKMQKLPGGVTEENIITAWHILEEETFKDEPSIGIVMRNHTPHLLDEKTFEVAVSNAMNIDTLKKYEATILSYIRDSVGSDSLTMSIRTLTPAERPKFYTKPQRLQILKERYSALDKLCKELDLEVTLG
jgi:DNA polymerase-3 subunit gamma/tau